jgi:hypothetical protein
LEFPERAKRVALTIKSSWPEVEVRAASGVCRGAASGLLALFKHDDGATGLRQFYCRNESSQSAADHDGVDSFTLVAKRLHLVSSLTLSLTVKDIDGCRGRFVTDGMVGDPWSKQNLHRSENMEWIEGAEAHAISVASLQI